VLLLTAVGRSGTLDLSVAMLTAFILGLLTSNSIVAWLATGTFKKALACKQLFLIAGVLAGSFSIALGLVFTVGS